MNTLDVYLALLGGLVLLALLGHGLWQKRQAQPKQAKARAVEAREEPGSGSFPHRKRALTTQEAPQGLESEWTASRLSSPLPAETLAVDPSLRRLRARLDPLIDALVTIPLEYPLDGASILAVWPHTLRAGRKPFFIEAFNIALQDWETPVVGERYGALQAGVQLANRQGPINEIEFSEFIQKLQGVVEPLAAMPDYPDMMQEVARARELDAFAAEHDVQLAVRLVAKGASWSVGYIQQQAGSLGLAPGVVPGRWVLPGRDEGDPPVLVLQYDHQAALAGEPDQASVRELSLSLDVPQTAPERHPFQDWRDMAGSLARQMDAVIVDDQGQPVGEAAFTGIEDALSKVYAELSEQHLAAGSLAARRVFS